VSLVADLHRRFATLIAELTKFGLIGTVGLVTDVGGANLLHGPAGLGPLTAKAISATVATVLSYAGHRLWTFRHRANQGLLRGWLIFFGLNLVGLLVSLLVIVFFTDVLRLHGLAAYNVAQACGVGLGMLFRYWSYRRFVFLAFEPGEQAGGPDGGHRHAAVHQAPGRAAGQPAAGQPAPGPQIAGPPAAGHTGTGHTGTGHPATGHPAPGHPASSRPASGPQPGRRWVSSRPVLKPDR
jgi:putative flippase GtrA